MAENTGVFLEWRNPWALPTTKIKFDANPRPEDEIHVDLKFDRVELSNRAEILDWLGSPLEADEKNDSITYEYKLKGDEPDSMKARFTVWFDETGE